MTRNVTGFALILALPLLLVLSACGGDSGSDPSDDGPDGVSIQNPPASVDLDEQIQLTASYDRGREAPDCAWYVDGVLGGDAATGTITQENPATYTAPSSAPDGGAVEISVVTDDEDALEDDFELCIHASYGIALEYLATECQISER